MFRPAFAHVLLAGLVLGHAPAMPSSTSGSRLLDDTLMITWYGNPRSKGMGILGEQMGSARAEGLRRQAEAYGALTSRRVLMAYHLVAVVAQNTPGADGLWRRRETDDVIADLLAEARRHGFHLVLDIQPGHASVANEVAHLTTWLSEPDVHLALDPEFAMPPGEAPGRRIGRMAAAEVNHATTALEALVAQHRLPGKMLIVHQFRLDMLPDKALIRSSDTVEVVLDMDGFGSQSLKRDSYRTVMRRPLMHAAIKLFYRQDRNLFSPAQVLALSPAPSVVIYQ